MLPYPRIDNVAFQIGPFKIYWYGIMYLVGFGIAWLLAKYKAHQLNYNWETGIGTNRPEQFDFSARRQGANNRSVQQVHDCCEQRSQQRRKSKCDGYISDLIFYCALGVIIGGRIGYILFYSLPDFLNDPLFIFKTWLGGMSFHGGVIGVTIALYFFAKKMQLPFLTVSDFLVPLAPLGLMFGRIGNFINGELWGRITTMPWGMVFPKAGALPRHPSQLYEALLEGLLLFIILWVYSNKPRPRGTVSGLFLIGYGVLRFFCEFFRTPDVQLGFIAFDWMTMGQLLSIPMIIAGIIMMAVSIKNKYEV